MDLLTVLVKVRATVGVHVDCASGWYIRIWEKARGLVFGSFVFVASV